MDGISGPADPERQASTVGALCVILDRQVSSCVYVTLVQLTLRDRQALWGFCASAWTDTLAVCVCDRALTQQADTGHGLSRGLVSHSSMTTTPA